MQDENNVSVGLALRPGLGLASLPEAAGSPEPASLSLLVSHPASHPFCLRALWGWGSLGPAHGCLAESHVAVSAGVL